MRDLVDTLKSEAEERGVKKFPTIQRSNTTGRLFYSVPMESIYPSIDTDFPSTGYTLQSLDPDSIYGYYVLTANTFGQFVTKMEALIEDVSNV